MTVPVNLRVTPAHDPKTYFAVDDVNGSPRGYSDELVSFANDAYATLGKLVEMLDVVKRVRDVLSNSGANGPAFHRAFDRVRGAKQGEPLAIEKTDTAARAALNIQPSA